MTFMIFEKLSSHYSERTIDCEDMTSDKCIIKISDDESCFLASQLSHLQ